MPFKQVPLITAGQGNAYLISVYGRDIQTEFDAATGLSIAFRVTWNIGHTKLQFPSFCATLHDQGVFYVGTDACVELLYTDTITYAPAYNLVRPDQTKLPPGDVTAVKASLAPGQFTVFVMPLAMRQSDAQNGPLAAVLPSPGNLPPLTCTYRLGSDGYKPSVYATHAGTIRTGDAFRASIAAGAGVYDTPGQLAAISDGIRVTATAGGDPAQIRWFYGAG